MLSSTLAKRKLVAAKTRAPKTKTVKGPPNKTAVRGKRLIKRVVKRIKAVKPVLTDDRLGAYNDNPDIYPDYPELTAKVREMSDYLVAKAFHNSSMAFIYHKINTDGTVDGSKLLARNYTSGSCYGNAPGIHPNGHGVDIRTNKPAPAKGVVLAAIDFSTRRVGLKAYPTNSYLSPSLSPSLIQAPPDRWSMLTEPQKSYLYWVVVESPWRHAFLVKDPRWVFNHGAVYDVHFSSLYLLAAGMCLRQMGEYPGRIKFWYAMKEMFSPELAMAFACTDMYRFNSNGTLESWHKYPNTNIQGGSSPFNHIFAKAGLKKYLSHDMSAEKPMMKMSQLCTYSGFNTVWATEPSGNYIEWGVMDAVTKSNDYGESYKLYPIDIANLEKWFSAFVIANNLEDVFDVKSKTCVYHQQQP